MGSTEWLEVMWGPGQVVRQWGEVGAGDSHSTLVTHPQGYLSVLHLKAVVYVSLDNAVLGEPGQCHHLAPWGPPLPLGLSPEPGIPPLPVFQGMTSFMPRPAPF